jgi:hypothetical protein
VESEPQSKEPATRAMVWISGQGEGVVAILGREGVAEDHNFDGGGGWELTDVGETGGGVHVEAGLLKDKAVGVNELVVVAKD